MYANVRSILSILGKFYQRLLKLKVLLLVTSCFVFCHSRRLKSTFIENAASGVHVMSSIDNVWNESIPSQQVHVLLAYITLRKMELIDNANNKHWALSVKVMATCLAN